MRFLLLTFLLFCLSLCLTSCKKKIDNSLKPPFFIEYENSLKKKVKKK